ncbi:MAG: L-seryl-tRNA(Sec) selenium transferase [Pelagibacterium sp. SCN 64-44]|nr:MAG: L-seryl-tRNA(Sec) selenium transferase [Pelagibacterium sp. SCN 64-44]
MTHKLADLPAVHEIIDSETGKLCVSRYGHDATLKAAREAIDALRGQLLCGGEAPGSRVEAARVVSAAMEAALALADQTRMRRVFNLTGTVLHTNLGRAVYAEAAVQAATTAMRHPLALEYDLDGGQRGQRDDAVQALVAEITGAEDACVVNNNASAVLLVLAALAANREAVVSRGELIEIGGSFRMPEIMAGAGAILREVGTTNRTHLRDYEAAIGPDTALFLKVHTSNYKVVGFTKAVEGAELAALAKKSGVPLVDDLGSGVLVDLSRWGLTRERTVQEALAEGADLVTFSGDKLLGGPQAGFIAGRRDLVRACASHPLKRALRLDKVRLAALEATLKLYRDPESLATRLPTLHMLARGVDALRALADEIAPALAEILAPDFSVEIADCQSQVGSGALPLDTIPSLALRIPAGSQADRLASAFRQLPIPVIGRIEKGALLLDLRCLDDVAGFRAQLSSLHHIIR